MRPDRLLPCYTYVTLGGCVIMSLWRRLAQEVSTVIWQLDGCRFDSMLRGRRSVSEQGTSTLIAPNELYFAWQPVVVSVSVSVSE